MGLPSIDQPEEGFYRFKLVRGGHWIPCKIWLAATAGSEDQTPVWQCIVNGQPADVWEVWPRVGGRKLTEEDYNKILLQRSPGKPIDKLKTKVVF